MLFLKVAPFFLFLIILNNEFDFSLTQKCNGCHPRTFRSPETCVCPDKQFCHPSTKTCLQCDKCYDNSYDDLSKIKKEVEEILKNLIKRYEENLDELQSLLKTLSDNVRKNRSLARRLETISDQLGEKIPTVAQNLNKLKNDVKKIEDKMKGIGSLPKILEELQKIKTKMETILEVLKNLNLDGPPGLEKFTEILDNIDNRFPTIDSNRDPLGLSFSIEYDIDHLETVLSKIDNGNGSYDSKTPWNTAWIEKDLFWMFTLLNKYGNGSFDIDLLRKNATHIRTEAEETKQKLQNLIEKLTELLEKYRAEVEFYKELKKLMENLKQLTQQIKQKMHEVVQIKEQLKMELNKFDEEIELLIKKKKDKDKFKSKMNTLLKEAEALIKKLEATKNIKPIDELLEEIRAMISETREIKERISAHCLSTLKG